MCAMSESDISVPIDISAAAFRTASRSSGRMAAKSVSAQFVRNPGRKFGQTCKQKIITTICRTHFSDNFGVR
jgi:hypothetical protein